MRSLKFVIRTVTNRIGRGRKDACQSYIHTEEGIGALKIGRKRTIGLGSFCLSILLCAVTLGTGCVGNKEQDLSVIHYSSMWKESEPQAIWLKSVTRMFTEDTGIRVQVDFKGREVLTKEKANLVMNTPPDIIEQDINELTAAMLNKEILALPLDDLFNGVGPEGQKHLSTIFEDKLLKLYQRGGKNYFMPYELITSMFICDKDKLEKHGGVPKTWSAFLATGEKLKAAGITPLVLDGNIYGYNAYYYTHMTERIMGPGAMLKAARDESGASFDEPGFLQAAQLISDISASGRDFFQRGYQHSNYPQGQGYWAKGNAGSIFCGTWIPVETHELTGSSFRYGFYPFPQVTSGVGKSTDIEAGLIGGMIPRGAKNPEHAKELLKFLVSRKNMEYFAKSTLNISARKDVAYPALLADVEHIVKNATNYFKLYDGLMAEAPEWLASVFFPLNNQLVFGEITAEEFIAQLKLHSIEFYKGNH